MISIAQFKGTSRTRLGVTRNSAIILLVIILLAAAGGAYIVTTSALGSQGSSNCTQSSTQQGSTVSISIPSGASNSANAPGYSPDNITLVIGVNNTVMWRNDDSASHTVTSSNAPSCGTFNSGNLSSGESWTHTFTVSGVYHYYCKYHSWMTGSIVVVS